MGHLISCFQFRLKSICALLILLSVAASAQEQIIINMAAIDGVPINPANIFSYTMQSTTSVSVQVKGSIRYRTSNMNLSYTYTYQLEPGMNKIIPDQIQPIWQVSHSGLRELFFTYNMLPEGTYEYCVTVTPNSVRPEMPAMTYNECLYHRADGFFLINLIDPEDKAKLDEFNPMLSWVANYSFSNELNYRLRVAEIKEGQNPVSAVMRNQPMFDQKDLMQNSIIYPIYAKPLKANQPYAWTVDAYFRGILLGGSETWQFIIPEDTPVVHYPVTRSYIDIKREGESVALYIPGELKIKFLLERYRKDILTLQISDEGGKPVKIKPDKLNITYGDNRFVVNLKESANLRHKKKYTLTLNSQHGEQYKLSFIYLNPEFIH